MSTDKKLPILQNNPLDGIIPDYLHREGKGGAAVAVTVPRKKKAPGKQTAKPTATKKPAPKTQKPAKSQVKETTTVEITSKDRSHWRLSIDSETLQILDDIAFDIDDSRSAALKYVLSDLKERLKSGELQSLAEPFRDARGKTTGRKSPVQIQFSPELQELMVHFRNILRIRSRSELARVLVRLWKSMD